MTLSLETCLPLSPFHFSLSLSFSLSLALYVSLSLAYSLSLSLFFSLSLPLPLPRSLPRAWGFQRSCSVAADAQSSRPHHFGQFTWTAAYRTGSRSRSGKVSGCTVTGLNTVIRLRCRTCLFGRCPGPAVLTGSRPLSKVHATVHRCPVRSPARLPASGSRRVGPPCPPPTSSGPTLPPTYTSGIYLQPWMYLLLYLPPTCTFLQLHTSSRRQASTRLSRSSLPMTIYNLSSEGLHFHSTPLH